MKKLIIALIVCAVVTGFVMNVVPADQITTFEDGSPDVTITFTGGGYDKSTKLSIPNNSTIDDATMKITCLPDGSGNYPRNVSVDIGADKKSDYRFYGTGYGAWGKQTYFKDNFEQQKTYFFYGGALEQVATVRLPKNATVSSASVQLRQFDLPNYGFRLASDSDYASTVASVYVCSSDYSTASYRPLLTVDYVGGSYSSPQTNALKDARVTSGNYANSNYGTDYYLLYYYASMAYVQFDLGSIPADAVVTDAEFGVSYPSSYYKTNIGVYTAAGSWNENTITYNNKPGAYPQKIDTLEKTGTYHWYADVTSIVQQWVGATPSNIGLDVGDTGTNDWNRAGSFTGAVTTGDWGAALNTYLSTAAVTYEDSYGNKFVDVPIAFNTASPGAIKVTNLDIKYDYTATIDKRIQGDLTGTLNGLVPDGLSAPESGDCIIPINITSQSAGKVKLHDLDITYTGPNYRPTTSAIPDAAIDEDSPDATLVDLSQYFFDDKDDPTTMKYKVQANDQDDFVDVTINDDGYHLSAVPSQDWNGVTKVKVSATDSGGKYVFSNHFNITVNPVNDEPTVTQDMEAFSMDEGYTQIMMTLSKTTPEQFQDIDSQEYFYWVQVDPDNTVTDEQLEGDIITKAGDNDNFYLRLKAKGDWNTEGKDPVPIRLICDDDDAKDDVPVCYIDVDVTVFPVNDAPVWKPIEDVTMDEDTVLVDYLDLTEYVTDIESPIKDLKFKIYSNDNKSKIEVDISSDNLLSIEPKPNYDGSTEVTLEVDDGDNKTHTDFNIIVNGINDVPTINLLSPNDGTTVNEAISVMGNADDVERTLEKVEVKIDGGAWEKAEGTFIWTYELDPLVIPKGDHTLSVRAYDGIDYSDERTINFNVEVGGTPGNDLPTVTILAPKDGAGPLSGEQEIKGKAADPDGTVTKVELTIDGKVFQAEGTTSWTFNWNTPTTQKFGTNVTISAKATDDKGDGGPSSTITVLVKNSDSDGDKMPDWYEDQYADLDSHIDDAMCDPDEDGYINFDEFQAGTDPMDSKDHPGEEITTDPEGQDMAIVYYIMVAVLIVVVLVIIVIILLMVMTNIKKKKAEREQEEGEVIPVMTGEAIPMDQPQPIPLEGPTPIPMDQPQPLPQQNQQYLPPVQ